MNADDTVENELVRLVEIGVDLVERLTAIADQADRKVHIVDGRSVYGVVWSAQIRAAIKDVTS